MFSFIRDRYVELDFPFTLPDCEVNRCNKCCIVEIERGRNDTQTNKPITEDKSRGKHITPRFSDQSAAYDYNNEFNYSIKDYLKENPIQPTKAEYKRLKDMHHVKHVADQSRLDGYEAKSANKQENQRFNRYINIFPYDFNRIKLKKAIQGSDYLNASYITGPLSEGKDNSTISTEENLKPFEFSQFANITFLATMGPLQATLAHHWQAIYETDVDIIVMLTKLREGGGGSGPGTPKCVQYWPSNKEKALKAGNIEITLQDDVEFTPEIRKRIFSIKNTSDSSNTTKNEKRITQLQYIGWPDYGVPEEGDHLTKLVKKVRYIIQSDQDKISNGKKFTVLAHCSAGVGRTGTFIAMYQMMDRIEDMLSNKYNNSQSNGNQFIDIFKEVLELRSKRVEMVQSWAQYKYLYKSIAEYSKQVKALNENNPSDYADYDLVLQ